MASKREALIASAEKSLQKGKVDAALKDYLKVLEETPGDINILNKIGDLYVRLNRNDESIPFFTRIAEHYSKDGFFLKAIAIYKKINKLDPSRLEVYERLAVLYGKQGLAMEAKSQYQVLADYYLKQDNLNGAVGIYQKMVQAEPANIQLHVKLADLFTQAKRVPDALKEYAIVAGILRDRGAHAEAIQVYDKALKIAPDNVEILRAHVPLLLETGAIEPARAVLRRALETTPRSVPLFVLAAEAALVANDMADARNYGAKAQAVDPENEEVLATVVKIQLKGRRPDLAYPPAATLADHAVKKGEYKRALAILTPVAKVAPDHEDLLRKVVEISSRAGDEAGTIPYRSALAEIWRKQGKLAEAVEALRICARLAPDNPEFRTRLAHLEPAVAPPPPPPPVVPPTSASFGQVEKAPPEFLAGPAMRGTAPAAATGPAPPAHGAGLPTAEEFEFDLADDELADTAADTPTPIPRGPSREAPPPSASFRPPPLPSPYRQPAGPGPMADTAPGTRFEPQPPVAYPAAGSPPSFGMDVPTARPVPPPPPDFGMPYGGTDFGFGAKVPEPQSPSPEWYGFDAPAAAAPPPVASRPAVDPRFPSLHDIETVEEIAEVEVPSPAGARPYAEAAEVEEAEELPPGSAFPTPAELRQPLPASPSASAAALNFDFGEPSGFLSSAAPAPLPAPAPASPATVALPAIDMPVPPPRVEAAPPGGIRTPSVVMRRSPTDVAIEEALVEADVFRKYGILEKAVEQLRQVSKKYPESLKVREKLFEILLEQGKKAAARKEAEVLTEAYRAEGREDRLLALASLLGDAPLRPAPPQAPSAAPAVQQAPEGATVALPAVAPPAAPTFVPPPAIDVPLASPPPSVEAIEAVEAIETFAPPPHPEPAAPIARPEPPRPPQAAPPLPATPAAPGRGLAEDPFTSLLGLRAPRPKAIRPEDVDLLLPVPTPAARPKPTSPSPSPADMLSSLTRLEPAAPQTKPPATPVDPLKSLLAGAGGTRYATPPAVPQLEVRVEAPPSPRPEPARLAPTDDELSEIDFCLDQGMVVDAAERLQALEGRYPGHAAIASRRQRLEGARSVSEESRPALDDLLSEDLESVLDAELGRALTDDMARGATGAAQAPPPAATAARESEPNVDESALFSDEQEFFNFADEIQSELNQEVAAKGDSEIVGEVSLEEIFREFKKGVEQQLSPEDYETHYNLGIAYKEMGLTDEAIGEFQNAAKDPNRAVECCSMLGLCFLEKGLPQLAIKWYRKGLETPGIKDDDRLGLLYDLATVYGEVGDRENAYRTFLDIYGTNASFRDVQEKVRQLGPAA